MRKYVFYGVALCVAWGGAAVERVADPRSLWDVRALDAAPETYLVAEACSNEYGRLAGVDPIWIAGEPFRGKPTRVFAWWGLPKGARRDAKVPAMVLIHGGGGTAFANWVKVWTDRGYAAIAMDTCGRIPQGERDGRPHNAHAWSGPSGWGSSVDQVDDPLRDQWVYHAVAAVMRCHSFLRTRPEVDAARVGLTGISWGGYLTSIVMGIDRRFRFAAPVYGCGWYDLNLEWAHEMDRGNGRYAKWLEMWDARNFMDGVRCPVLWCCGTNDRYYPLNAIWRSCQASGREAEVSLSVKLRMPHGHMPCGDPPEITAFAEHMLKGGVAPVKVTRAVVEGTRIQVAFDAGGMNVVRAEVLSTCDSNPVLMDRPWSATAVAEFSAAEGTARTSVPPGTLMALVNLVTDRGLVFSSPILLMNP